MTDIREEDLRNVEFDIWKVYDEISRNREFIYKCLFDIENDKIQNNLRTIYEKVGVFCNIKSTNERDIHLIDLLMQEVKKIITDYVPLKKIYSLDRDTEKIESINKEVFIATRHIMTLVGDVLGTMMESKKKRLASTCSKFVQRWNKEGGEGHSTGVRIWSAKDKGERESQTS